MTALKVKAFVYPWMAPASSAAGDVPWAAT